MTKKSISTKAFLVLLFGTIILALLSSCSNDEYYLDAENTEDCITQGYDVLEGEYASYNGAIVIYFSANGTMGLRQGGMLNGVSSYCFTPDGSYLRFTNEFNQVSYSSYDIVDTLDTKGIVLDGLFYETLVY